MIFSVGRLFAEKTPPFRRQKVTSAAFVRARRFSQLSAERSLVFFLMFVPALPFIHALGIVVPVHD